MLRFRDIRTRGSGARESGERYAAEDEHPVQDGEQEHVSANRREGSQPDTLDTRTLTLPGGAFVLAPPTRGEGSRAFLGSTVNRYPLAFAHRHVQSHTATAGGFAPHGHWVATRLV
jgi:hypothetical protein